MLKTINVLVSIINNIYEVYIYEKCSICKEYVLVSNDF